MMCLHVLFAAWSIQLYFWMQNKAISLDRLCESILFFSFYSAISRPRRIPLYRLHVLDLKFLQLTKFGSLGSYHFFIISCVVSRNSPKGCLVYWRSSSFMRLLTDSRPLIWEGMPKLGAVYPSYLIYHKLIYYLLLIRILKEINLPSG